MKTISGIEFASEHNGTDVFRLIELAYEQGQKDGHSEQLGTNLAEVGTDAISRQKAIDALTEYGNGRAVFISVGEAVIRIEQLPSAQPEIIRCKDCRYYDHEGLQCLDIYGYGRRWEENDWCSYAERREVTT